MALGNAQLEHSSIADRRNGPERRYRIAIVTHGGFHILDLARELHNLEHEVVLYSVLPKRRVEENGLPAKCYRGLLPYLFPLAAAARRGPRALQDRFDSLFQRAVDRLAAAFLEPCDILIGMSGMCFASLAEARRRFGAKIFLERGSRHILSQKEILESIPVGTSEPVPNFLIKRELWAYEFADVIAVPSRQAERSFLDRGIPSSKLFRNPYGIDLTLFPATAVSDLKSPTAIFVGTWSLRKGCDVLWEACRAANSWHLLHVGPVGDAPLPQSALFTHHDPVPRSELTNFYRRAHVCVLASREEGLSLVQGQALASGLPLVCTNRTGGEDFRDILKDPEWITVVPPNDVAALRTGVQKALQQATEQTGVRDFLGEARDELSWKAYGKRYSEEIARRLSDLPS